MCIKEILSKQLTERWDASAEYRSGWRQSFVYSALGYNRYELYASDGRLVFIADRPATGTNFCTEVSTIGLAPGLCLYGPSMLLPEQLWSRKRAMEAISWERRTAIRPDDPLWPKLDELLLQDVEHDDQRGWQSLCDWAEGQPQEVMDRVIRIMSSWHEPKRAQLDPSILNACLDWGRPVVARALRETTQATTDEPGTPTQQIAPIDPEQAAIILWEYDHATTYRYWQRFRACARRLPWPAFRVAILLRAGRIGRFSLQEMTFVDGEYQGGMLFPYYGAADYGRVDVSISRWLETWRHENT